MATPLTSNCKILVSVTAGVALAALERGEASRRPENRRREARLPLLEADDGAVFPDAEEDVLLVEALVIS
jgi:hypothetical protein